LELLPAARERGREEKFLAASGKELTVRPIQFKLNKIIIPCFCGFRNSERGKIKTKFLRKNYCILPQYLVLYITAPWAQA
jgi:hypothetical protein